METARRASLVASESVRVTNPAGTSPLVLTCDHASNFVPPEYGALGLSQTELSEHIAWDPGALAVAHGISSRLDTALIETRISRLVLDCNRPLDAPDLISEVSETTPVPGNKGLSAAERKARIARCWTPFHDAIDAVLEDRDDAGLASWLVSVHSFTPVYKGVHRPWHIGIIHDEDARLAAPLIAALEALPGITVGVNEPYSPADRVYFTLEKHARPRGLPCAMIEIRNDEIRNEAGQIKWVTALAGIFARLTPESRIPQIRYSNTAG
ncbi:N-formylglutamate amidohydrolase [Mesorhizobium sp. Root554]|uniref:N-formylglutamate amidohydrolase n=1 Tax=unclassified Mesorhizobium TaxID=325217 RepID=UPI0006F6B48B|nr:MULTISPECIES: N-formylglutamate amidohydrolase [unclassified Mesorhizobium]KQZ14514.1 N-formylglutamate amidohydrolase [Mesorhizobium sp. Root1471]KQZ37022.1 N-formylglutamate amidohydrolase [Mesorhizobium sp. Root554]